MPWTPDQIESLAGRVVVITGANTGLGYENAKVCAAKGAQTIMGCRSPERASGALARIRAEHPEARIEAMQLDLASFKSIRSFSEAFHEKYDRLDGLLNNAGIMFTAYGLTEDGLEQQTGVNHFGHFLLTGLLLDRLLATPGSRVVNVSSAGHRMGRMDFDNLHFEAERGYSPRAAYGRSKLQNLLFTFELQRRLEAAGADTIAVAAHPGGSATELGRHVRERSRLFRMMQPLFDLITQSAYMGSLPTLRAFADPEVKGGSYFGPDGFMESRGHPVEVGCSRAAKSEEDARRLWEVSEKVTGVRYAFSG